MFPLVVSTYPENGSSDVGLDDIIKVTFDGELDVTTVIASNIQLENYTTGNLIENITVTVADANTSVVVTAPQTATGNHRYEGLNEYRLNIANVKSSDGDMIFGIFQVRFTTEAGSVTEATSPPISGSLFEVYKTYPKDGAIVTPTTIKVKCTSAIASDTPVAGVMLLDGSTIDDIEDALFIGQSLITASNVVVNGDVLEITPPTLASGTKYSVVVSGVKNSSGDEIIPYMFSFNAAFTPMYADVESVLALNIVKTLTAGRSLSEIAKLIHLNSKLAEFIANLAGNTDITWSNPPMYVGQYVIYKTRYDILFDAVAELSTSSTTKQLKDFMVDYRFSLADLLSLSKQVKLDYQYWEDMLKGQNNRGKASPATFVKGENGDEDPDFMDRKFVDMDGTKEW